MLGGIRCRATRYARFARTATIKQMKRAGRSMQLRGGGQIAFDEYGDPAGVPVLFCHGWPSARSMAQLTAAAAKKLGVRVISPDRPGICGSSFLQNRTLLDWPGGIGGAVSHLGGGQ